MGDKQGHLPGVTPRSVAASIFCMVLLGMIAQFTEVTELATGNWISHHPLSMTAILLTIVMLMSSALVWRVSRICLFSRPELLCILFSMALAAPIISQGFWQRIITTSGTLPRTSDFKKMDAFSDKLWPHGPNILEGALSRELIGAENGISLEEVGNVEWKEVEYNVKHGKELRAMMPTMTNSEADGVSLLRIKVPIEKDGEPLLLLQQPYLFSALVRGEELGADAQYFCRVYYDDSEVFSDEAFASRAAPKITYLQQEGFWRLGKFDLKFPVIIEKYAVFEIGLNGEGSFEVTDLKLMDVSGLQAAFTGRKIVGEAEYSKIPPEQRANLIVKPDNMLSLAGLSFILTGYIPLSQWVGPVVSYGGFVVCLLFATFALNVIMRRQWVDNERYPLPVTQIPLALLGKDEEQGEDHVLSSIWRNKLMWTGFAATFFWCLMRLWHAYNPKVPDMSVDFNLKPYFADPSWGKMWNGVSFSVVATFVALAVFMELNILLSMVVGYFFFRMQFWFGKSTGLDVYPEFPFGLYQEVGAFAAYAVVVVFFTRKYLWGVLKDAVTGNTETSGEEVFSYRTAVLLFLGSFVVIYFWAKWVGLGVTGSLVFFGFMVLIGFLCSKWRTECGTPFSHYGPIRPFLFLAVAGGMYTLGAELVAFSVIMSFILSQTVFYVLPGIQMELMELGRRFKMIPRHAFYTFILGLAGGLLVGGWVFLSSAYSLGGENMAHQWAFADKGWLFTHYNVELLDANQKLLASTEAATAAAEPAVEGSSPPYIWAIAFAAGATVVVSVLRQLFAGFWFHPFALLLAPCHMMQIVWGSMLTALVIRFTVLKLGGAATVRKKLIPFFVGVILGALAAYVVTGMLNTWLYFFFPAEERFGVLF